MKRIVLKLSGEALGEVGFSAEKAQFLVSEIASAQKESDVQIAIVIGGGNIWRGRDSKEFGFPSANSDAIGMGATLLNAAVLKNALSLQGIKSQIFSPHPFSDIAQKHTIEEEITALEAGEIVIFAGGTGAPFFTTDSAAVLRGLEIQADAVFKGTKVSGVYDADPQKNPNAKKFNSISFTEALDKNLKIMDATAFALARENQLPIYVFDAFVKGGISSALCGDNGGTWIGK